MRELVESTLVESTSWAGRARVLEVGADGLTLRVPDHAAPVHAALACAPGPVGRGDEVLAMRASDAEWFVIGVIGGAPAEHATRLVADDGAHATLDAGTLRFHRRDGTVLLEHDGARGVTRIRPTEGDIELLAPAGSVRIAAAAGVSLTGLGVDINARSRARVSVGADAAHRSCATLTNQSLVASADRVDLRAARSMVDLGDARLAAGRCRATAKDLDLEAGRIRAVADRLILRARVAWQIVTETLQQRVGRFRALISGSHTIRAERVSWRASKDVKIDGERIDLG